MQFGVGQSARASASLPADSHEAPCFCPFAPAGTHRQGWAWDSAPPPDCSSGISQALLALHAAPHQYFPLLCSLGFPLSPKGLYFHYTPPRTPVPNWHCCCVMLFTLFPWLSPAPPATLFYEASVTLITNKARQRQSKRKENRRKL